MKSMLITRQSIVKIQLEGTLQCCKNILSVHVMILKCLQTRPLLCPQTGKKGHSSVEDAKATMELYKVVEEEWERELASKSQAS